MTPELLENIGLNHSQAKAYLVLIESGALTPTELANKILQKRTTTYMIMNQLETLGLVEKTTKGTKTAYEATNPIALEKLSESRRKQLHQAETRVKQAMPALLSYYYSITEKPGIRLVQGVEGLKDIYADTLRAKQDIYFLRTPADVAKIDQEYFDKYRQKRATLGIKTYAFTPDTAHSRASSNDDEKFHIQRQWISSDIYSAPVEIDVYGDKTALLSFGEDIIGVIIQSPTIAEAMKQLISNLPK
ncbi:hypothetical protein KC867_00065 [Candidatus Saccharibacteria bacterium]|nr:hypothetical protein [Candidatus Saccharibacteria bacterium]